MKKPKRAKPKQASRILEIALWLIVLVLLFYRFTPQLRAALGMNSEGHAAPAVSFALLDGSDLSLEQLRGQVVLVNFWATWCPPCRMEMPGFQQVYEERRADGFTIIGLSSDSGTKQRVEAFLRDRKITYPVGYATAEAETAFGGVNGLPTSFLIDRQGRVRYTVKGIFTEVALRQAVDRLLAEHS